MSEDLYVLAMDGMQQSAVDLADPTRLVFDYMRRIGDVLDRLPDGPLRVLHVGGAAMTLPRYVRATRPGSAQIVLEPSSSVVEQVRAEAPLPRGSGIKVRVTDGLSGIAAVRERSQDAVVLDAFAGGVVPSELVSGEFLQQVRRVLRPDGLLVANLVDRPPFRLVRSFVAAARLADLQVAVGVEPATLKARRAGNLIVLGGEVPPAPFGSPSPMEYRVFLGRAAADSFGGGIAT